MKKVFILLADGFELLEVTAPLDILRRGGVEVSTLSITESLAVQSSHNVTLKADSLIGKINNESADVLIIPGGYPGYLNLSNSKKVIEIVRRYFIEHKIIAAICGGPVVIYKASIANGYTITCHSSVKNIITGYNILETNCPGQNGVITDRNIITSVGAGHAMDFSFEILNKLCGEEVVKSVKCKMEIYV